MISLGYDFSKDYVMVKEDSDRYSVFEYLNKSPIVERYKAMTACEWDVNYAIACLDQMFFQENTSLVDGCLINTSILILVRLFSNPKNKGRVCFDSTKVLRTFSTQKGFKDYTNTFKQFYNARNQIIAHDQQDFKETIIGITVDKTSNEAIDLCTLAVRTRFLYKENQQLLKEIYNVIKLYISDQLELLKNKIIAEYNTLEMNYAKDRAYKLGTRLIVGIGFISFL